MILPKSHNPMINGLQLKLIIRLLKLHIFLVALTYTRSWKRTVQIVGIIREKIRQYRGPKAIQKVARVNGKYYWDMYGVGWPSRAFVRNVKRECNRIESGSEHAGMRNVLMAITTKCPLQCEHCFEWNNLNIKERLSFSDLTIIIEKLIDHGVGQIHLSGGEPMMRYDEILKLLEKYSGPTGFWIITSGYGVTPERAQLLKKAGLTGLSVSLDHHLESNHNRFRNHRDAFAMAQQAVKAGNAAGLVTSLSLCSTREYTTAENLMTYAELARSWGVSFIQLLEPKAVGHYEGKPVHLSEEHKKVLKDFFITLNNHVAYSSYPNVIYHEYYMPTIGCRGAGNGTFYIDPLGEVHPCPFCRNASGNLVSDSVESCLSNLRGSGCPSPSVPLPQIGKRVAVSASL
jgi:MoaA/NifB/PqqE/SkfB family radical SAM enzyme